MAEKKTYTGGCHCGEVRFEVTADLSSVVSCNCSICQKRGALWVFVALESFALRAGLGGRGPMSYGSRRSGFGIGAATPRLCPARLPPRP